MTPSTLCPLRAGEPAPAVSPATPISLQRVADARLVTLARTGSDPAFAELVRRHQPALTRHCRRLGAGDLAEDAVGQAFLQAYIALRGSEEDVAFRPWLYRIGYHCVIDLLRKEPPAHEELDLQYDGVPQPPQLVEQKERLRALTAAAAALPQRQREAIVMRELEGRSYDEIAATVGDSPSAVRQLIFRARATLRSGLAALTPFLPFRLPWFAVTAEPCAGPVGGCLAAKAAVAVATAAVAVVPLPVATAHVSRHVEVRVHASDVHVVAALGAAVGPGERMALRVPDATQPSGAAAKRASGAAARRHHRVHTARAAVPAVRAAAPAPAPAPVVSAVAPAPVPAEPAAHAAAPASPPPPPAPTSVSPPSSPPASGTSSSASTASTSTSASPASAAGAGTTFVPPGHAASSTGAPGQPGSVASRTAVGSSPTPPGLARGVASDTTPSSAPAVAIRPAPSARDRTVASGRIGRGVDAPPHS